MPKFKRLVVSGDSWTYGSEIRDPKLPESVKDWDEPNDAYRLPKIWPTKLGNYLGVDDVVNLSYPAASNDRIVRNLVGWLTSVCRLYVESRRVCTQISSASILFTNIV